MESPCILRLMDCIPNMVGKGVFKCLQKQHTDGAFIPEAMMKWWERGYGFLTKRSSHSANDDMSAASINVAVMG